MRRTALLARALLLLTPAAHAATGICDAVPLAAVEVESSAGSAAGVPKSYANLGAAFTAINAGSLHRGAIHIDICSDVSEGTTPATLNSGGAGGASYTSLTIRPVTTALTIFGNPVSGFGVIQLNGADNVTIDGDDPNTAGTNRDLTIENTAAPNVVASSVIRIATSTAVTSANDISIKNLLLNGNVTSGNASTIQSGSSSSAVSFGIYVGGNGGPSSTGAPTAITTSPATAPSGTTVNNFLVDNNAINQCATGVRFNGAAVSVSTGVTISNNTIGSPGIPAPADPPYTSPVTTVYAQGVRVSGTNAVAITGNTVQNVVSYSGGGHAGIALSQSIGTGTISISNNTITSVVSNNSDSARGIALSAASGAYLIHRNFIHDVQNFSTNSGLYPTGIFVNTAAPSGTIEQNKVEKIQSRGNDSAKGVNLSSGNNVTVRNNFISDVNHIMPLSLFNIFDSPVGIFVRGLGHKIHHNTVNMFGPRLGTPNAKQLSAAFAIAEASSTGVDVRNNIFANSMTGGTTSSVHAAVYLPANGTAAMNLTWNNNAYFTGSTVGVHGVAQVGSAYITTPEGPPSFAGLYTPDNFHSELTSDTTNFRHYTSSLGGSSNDNASLATSLAPPFTSNTDLHIPSETMTQLESSGAAVGLVDDIDGDSRLSTPDIGADEFAGTFADLTGPTILYTPLGNTVSIANRALVTSISDTLSGMPTSGSGLPVIYFRKGSLDPYAAKPCRHQGGSVYDCEIDYTLVAGGSVTNGDVVEYFVAAQDGASTPNVAVNPGAGAGGLTADPPSAGTPPPAPSRYVIASRISGTYFVGAGESRTSLTNPGGIFEFLNSSALIGDVTIEITSDLVGETGTHALNQWLEDGSGGYRLTIKPTGASRLISGTTNATAVIKLNGADFVTIDGSLADPSGTDRSLTIKNNNLSGAAIWIASASESDGASDNVVKNCNITGVDEYNPFTAVGIFAGGRFNLTGPANAPNSNNQIRNNGFSVHHTGVRIQGSATTRDKNWLLTENTFTYPIRSAGITLSNAEDFVMSRNQISIRAWDNQFVANAIAVSGFVGGGVIEANTLNDILQNSGTSGVSIYGILANTSAGSGPLTIRNNSISDVNGYSNVYGIAIWGAGGVNIYHNSVNLFGFHDEGNFDASLSAAFYTSAATALDVRDNVFRNSHVSESPGAKSYAVACTAPASAFTAIDSNSYFATGPQGVLGFLGGARTTMTDWKAATGQDAHSIDPAVEPGFFSNTNLRPLVGAPVINAGAPVGVLTDITGAARSLTTPSMGAYEEPSCQTSAACDDGDPCTNDTCVAGSDPRCESAPVICNTPPDCRMAPGVCTFPGPGVCEYPTAPEGTSCGSPDASACNAADECDANGSCVDRKKPANTICLPGDASGCNPDDVCDGINGACPPSYAAELTPCGDPNATDCNSADSCNAAGGCVDRKKPANAVCQVASGECDLDDVCDGISSTCVPAYQPSTEECRPSTDECDPAEFCSGIAATCPGDVFDASEPVGNSVRVSHNRASGVSTISWDEAAPGPFNVYRGQRLDPAPFVYNHTCVAQDTYSASDTETPFQGELFYFLVSRDDETCPESTLGPDSTGSTRPNTAACSP